MSWKDGIKKEKYQGPQQKGGKFLHLHSRLMTMNQIISHLEKDSANPSEVNSRMIQNHANDLRKIIDDLDKDLIEMAKYGGSPSNLPTERQDSKWISNYGAKYRNTKEGV
jgi:hypothetical protein